MPALDAAQLEQAAAVRAALRRHLGRRGGWVGFDEYLEQVLYAPGLGYYSAGATKLGAAGDFITAPELSPLFGGCIARQCAPLLGAGRDLLELGAGSGALAEVLLTRLAELAALPDRYLILETSADLRERQRTRLQRLPAELRQRVQWLDALPQRALLGVILANEVADALPFQCFAKRSDGFEELGVSLDHSGAPQWSARPASAALRGELERIDASLAQPFAAGFRGELCLRLEPWIAGLAGADRKSVV
jgi:SAM-dependent MidA family methyltransferase